MRAIWKGHISFGLVNVPVSLYPAEQRTDLQLHMIDSRNFSRVRYDRVNAETGEEVPWDQIVKGFEYNDGNYVVLGKEELEKVSPKATQTVEIEAFVDLADIDSVYFERPYFLEPGKKGEKGYVLLREAMRESGKAGIAKVVIRTRQYLAAMAPRRDAIVLHLLRFQQELRSMDDLELPGSPDEVGVTKQEAKMARVLIDSMTSEWKPSEYHDEYREALMAWIDKRIESGEVERITDVEAPVVDEDIQGPYNIMDALQKSVAASGGKTARTSAPKTSKKAGATKKKTTKKKTKAPSTKKSTRKKAG